MVRFFRRPLYRRELARLGAIRPWHWIAAALLILAVSAMLCALPLAATGAGGVYPIPFGLFVTQEGLKQLTCLAAAVLAAASIRQEEQMISLLRVAGRPVRQIALGKLAAVLHRLWLPILLVSLLRLGFIGVEILLPVRRGFYIWREVAQWTPALPVTLRLSPAIQMLSALADGGLLAYLSAITQMNYSQARNLWMVLYLTQPLLDAALFAAAGLAAAARVRSSGSGIAAAVGLSGMLTGSGYLFVRLITQALIAGTRQFSARSTTPLRSVPELALSGPAMVPGFLLANYWLTGLPVTYAGLTRSITETVIVLTLAIKVALVVVLVWAAARWLGRVE